jgi:flagellin-like protein
MKQMILSYKSASNSRRRKAVSGVIGAVLLFAMIATVGTSYFVYINNANNLVNQALTSVNSQQINRIQEAAIINTALLSNNHIGYYLNNTGGVSINITSSLLVDPSGNIAKCYIFEKNAPSMCANTVSPVQTPSLPLVATVGKSLPPPGSGLGGWVDTGLVYVTGTYTLKLTSVRGSVFTQTYPPTPVPIASLAVTTQGAGIIQINFNTYFAYNLTSGTTCDPRSTSCALAGFPTGTLAYTMRSEAKTSKFYIYAVNVQNVDPQKRTIVLDKNCILNQFQAPIAGGGTASNFLWQIGSVSAGGVTQPFPAGGVTLQPNQVVTLYFTGIPGTNTNSWPAAGTFVAVFIFLHGSVSTQPFGQNVPFVTTLYEST